MFLGTPWSSFELLGFLVCLASNPYLCLQVDISLAGVGLTGDGVGVPRIKAGAIYEFLGSSLSSLGVPLKSFGRLRTRVS